MVKKKFMVFLFLFINFFGICYSETEPYSKLENDIAKNLRCLICQGQSIYDSNSEFALSMRIYIKDQIDNNEVCLFMKGTPDEPQCGFSMAVSNILKILEVNFKGINVLADQSIRDGIKTFSDWPTIPQLYVKKEFIGGCDIIKEMYETGDLKKLFDNKGIPYKK